MNARLARSTLLLSAALLARPALADVYAWVDDEGTVHYQEEPPPAAGKATAKRVRKLRLPAESPPAPAEPEPERASAASRGDRAEPARPRPRALPAVELYSTSWCPWCKKARAWFEARGVPYTDHDIEADPRALKRKLELDGHQRVPTVVIGDQVIRGYSESGYRAALGR